MVSEWFSEIGKTRLRYHNRTVTLIEHSLCKMIIGSLILMHPKDLSPDH